MAYQPHNAADYNVKHDEFLIFAASDVKGKFTIMRTATPTTLSTASFGIIGVMVENKVAFHQIATVPDTRVGWIRTRAEMLGKYADWLEELNG